MDGVATTLVAQVATPVQQFAVSLSVPSPGGFPCRWTIGSCVYRIAFEVRDRSSALASEVSSGLHLLDVYYDTVSQVQHCTTSAATIAGYRDQSYPWSTPALLLPKVRVRSRL